MQENQLSNRIWLGSVAFSTSFLLGLLINGSFPKALVTGFITLPSSLAGAFIADRRDIQETLIDGALSVSNNIADTAKASKNYIQNQIQEFQEQRRRSQEQRQQQQQFNEQRQQLHQSFVGATAGIPEAKTQSIEALPSEQTNAIASVPQINRPQQLKAKELELPIQPQSFQLASEQIDSVSRYLEQQSQIEQEEEESKDVSLPEKDLEALLSSVSQNFPIQQQQQQDNDDDEFEDFLDQVTTAFNPLQLQSSTQTQSSDSDVLDPSIQADEQAQLDSLSDLNDPLVKQSESDSIEISQLGEQDEYELLLDEISGILEQPTELEENSQLLEPTVEVSQLDITEEETSEPEEEFDEYERLMTQISQSLQAPEDEEATLAPKVKELEAILTDEPLELDRLFGSISGSLEQEPFSTKTQLPKQQELEAILADKTIEPDAMLDSVDEISQAKQSDEVEGILSDREQKELEELLWGSVSDLQPQAPQTEEKADPNKLFGKSSDSKRQK